MSAQDNARMQMSDDAPGSGDRFVPVQKKPTVALDGIDGFSQDASSSRPPFVVARDQRNATCSTKQIEILGNSARSALAHARAVNYVPKKNDFERIRLSYRGE